MYCLGGDGVVVTRQISFSFSFFYFYFFFVYLFIYEKPSVYIQDFAILIYSPVRPRSASGDGAPGVQ